LRSAKVKAIERGAPARTWAAFTVVGDPLVTIPLETPRRANWPVVVVLVVLVIAAKKTYDWRRRTR
jgi:hypothetical protein